MEPPAKEKQTVPQLMATIASTFTQKSKEEPRQPQVTVPPHAPPSRCYPHSGPLGSLPLSLRTIATPIPNMIELLRHKKVEAYPARGLQDVIDNLALVPSARVVGHIVQPPEHFQFLEDGRTSDYLVAPYVHPVGFASQYHVIGVVFSGVPYGEFNLRAVNVIHCNSQPPGLSESSAFIVWRLTSADPALIARTGLRLAEIVPSRPVPPGEFKAWVDQCVTPTH